MKQLGEIVVLRRMSKAKVQLKGQGRQLNTLGGILPYAVDVK